MNPLKPSVSPWKSKSTLTLCTRDETEYMSYIWSVACPSYQLTGPAVTPPIINDKYQASFTPGPPLRRLPSPQSSILETFATAKSNCLLHKQIFFVCLSFGSLPLYSLAACLEELTSSQSADHSSSLTAYVPASHFTTNKHC